MFSIVSTSHSAANIFRCANNNSFLNQHIRIFCVFCYKIKIGHLGKEISFLKSSWLIGCRWY